MTRVWIFQANPDRYDIDAALRELDVISWRVPQRTSEIAAGDIAVIWRSGPEAGIVGVGRILDTPRESTDLVEESRFDRGDGEEVGATTRTRVLVQASEFVPKEALANLPEFDGHRIITAPMGTVFPVDDFQWTALSNLLPDPPTATDAQAVTSPSSFAWAQRTKSISPLPGGIDAFLQVLLDILRHVDNTKPARNELDEWIAQTHEVSYRRATLTTSFLARIGLLRLESARVRLMPDGERWLRDADPAFLLALIHGRVQYIGEMLAHLAEPRTSEELLQHANQQYGMRWSTRGQIMRRRHLLGGLGAVEMNDDGEWTRTPFGDEAVHLLEIAPPLPDHAFTSQVTPDETETDTSPRPHPRADVPSSTDADRLVQQLLDTAHDSSNPDEFEKAIRDAFEFLGFDAVWEGGSGKTDILLTAPLSARERYRVVVDAKTTSHEAVGDQQIDWVTIDEHQANYEADHALVVAPAFKGQRIDDRARANRSVALLDVAGLSDVIRQHDVAPLGLDAYRSLFDPERGLDDVIDRGEVIRRQLAL
ncbi:MAG: EVE domain-containing protein, partial [Dehalococcoidia bacterium]